MKQVLLKELRRQLRGQLSRSKRRRNSSPWAIGGLVIAISAVSYLLHDPVAPPSSMSKGTQLNCTIQSVADGDTVTANCPNGKVKVRVFGIDAPEMGQKPWGDAAKQVLRGLLPLTDNVQLQVRDQDRYGRTVAQILVNGRDIGLEMVQRGQAMVYAQYNKSPLYKQAQAEAQSAKRGIWKEPGSQQNPAEWRRLNPR